MALSAECSRNCGSAMFRLRLQLESPGFQDFFSARYRQLDIIVFAG